MMIKYECKQCGGHFSLERQAAYCPYCGFNLQSSDEIGVAQIIDRIWGENANLKKEYLYVINAIIRALAQSLAARIEMTLPRREKPISFESVFAEVSACENRSQVLERTKRLMDLLHEKIEATATNTIIITEDVPFEKEDIEDIARNVLNELGLDMSFQIDCARATRTTIYVRDKLEEFYNYLRKAHKKYVCCVNENNMYAAFPTDSQFGNIGMSEEEYRGMSVLDEGTLWDSVTQQDGNETASTSEVDIEGEVDNLKVAAMQDYMGFPDEDFVPHVDSFWKGVRTLCRCIESNEREDIVFPKEIFDEKIILAIRRKINGSGFTVTDAKIRMMTELLEAVK